MAGGKLTPRQKMINMMYLVLIALLAMNVSKEVLEAFAVVEDGIANTNEVLVAKIANVDDAFTKKLGEDPDAEELHDKSIQVSAITQDLYTYIEDIKATLKSPEFSGTTEEGELLNLEDIDSPTRLLAEPSPDFMGEELQNKINDARTQIIEILEGTDQFLEADRQSIIAALTLNAPNNDEVPESDPKHFWYYNNFFQVPSAGTMAILTKIQNDVLSAEASANEGLYKTIGALTIKFDKLRAAIQAEKAYLPGGSTYESTIFLTASSSGIKTDVFIGKLDKTKFPTDSLGDLGPFIGADETETPFVNNEYKEQLEGDKYTAGTGVGQNSYEGAARIKNPKGEYEWYPFEGSYEGAAQGGFSASPTKMNVLYIGVPNPMSVTIGDAKPGTERVSLSGGSITGSGNSWTANVTTVGTATLSASGTTPDGTPTKAFSASFRVKRIPDPIPTLGGTLTGGNIQKGTLNAQSGVIAVLKDFDFDARFTVISYDFILSTAGEILPARGISGPLLNSQVKNLIQRAKSNDYVIFENIKVKGPDGQTRKIASITFKIV